MPGTRLIVVLVLLICLVISYHGILKPLYSNLVVPLITWAANFFSKKLEKTPLEKEEEALRAAKEEVKAVEIQRERIKFEKQAMRIRNSIIEEEFEEVDEKHTGSRSKL